MSVIASSTPASAGAPSTLTNPAIPHICEGDLFRPPWWAWRPSTSLQGTSLRGSGEGPPARRGGIVIALGPMPRLTDRNEIRSHLRRDPAWSVYALGDLEPPMFAKTLWFVPDLTLV